MTTGCPNASERSGATVRAKASALPPGRYGTMNRIGRDGYCARATLACISTTQISSARLKEWRNDIDVSLTRRLDLDGRAAPRGLRRSETRKHHRERADAAAGTDQHELVRIVERIVERRL